MAVRIAPVARQQFLDNQGRVAAGMKVFTYAAGTANKLATFTTSTGGVQNANPIVLDSAGRTPSGFWLTDGTLYKIVLAPANDTDPPTSAIWTEDNVNSGDATLAALAASTGATLIGWIRSAAGAVATTLAKWLGFQPPSPFDFMTDAQIADVQALTYSLDVTTPFQNWLLAISGKAGNLPAGGYKITAQLTFPANTAISASGRFAATIRKAFNGDFGNLQSQVSLTGVTIDANATTGKGLIVTGNNQSLLNCNLQGFADYCVHFSAAGSGSNFKMIGGEATRVSAADPSFGFPVTDTAGTPRYFIGVSTGGGIFGDLNNVTDLFVTNCFIRDFNWNDNCSLVFVTGCRWAALAGDVHIKGGGHVISGNSIAATNIYLDVGTNGVSIRGNGGYGNIIDNSAATLNSYEYTRKTYTPTWDQASGTQPALGDGTLVGVVTREGNVATVNIKLTLGASSTMGNNATAYRFSLPHKVYSQSPGQGGVAFITDASTGIRTVHSVDFNASTTNATISNMAGGSVRDTSPLVWAVGDSIVITGSYLCD